MLGLLLCAFRVTKWRHWKIEGPCLDSQSFPSLLLWKDPFSGHTVIDVGYCFLCWFIRYKMWRRGFDSPLVPFESSHPAVSPKLCSTWRLAEFGMAWQSRFINLVQCGKHMSFTTLVSPVALWTWWAWQQWWAGAGRRYFFGDPGFTGYMYCNTSCLSFWGSLYDLTAASH